jgi:integrase
MLRRYQAGSICTKGKWVVVRFRQDVPGSDKRVLASRRVCRVGTMSKAQQKAKVDEILREAKVNDVQTFIQTNTSTTFRQQAKIFLTLPNEDGYPVKPATLSSWKNCIETWLNPNLGDLSLAEINNSTLKALVIKMKAPSKYAPNGLSTKSQHTYIDLVKAIVGSATDEHGVSLFPYQWNNWFIGLQKVKNQRKPMFSAENITALLSKSNGNEQMLYALMAGTGLRAGEALGLEIKHISADFRTIYVRQSDWQGKTQEPKTDAAVRDIDLCQPLADMLRGFVGERTSGLVFATSKGKALRQSNILRRSLHPALKSLGIEKQGFHGFRRFRTTHLRKSTVPEDLTRFWIGHSDKTVTDGYSKLKEDANFRRECVDRAGLGFELSVPCVPQIQAQIAVEENTVSACSA